MAAAAVVVAVAVVILKNIIKLVRGLSGPNDSDDNNGKVNNCQLVRCEG